MLHAFISGVTLAFSLIAPIGAQNSFVLRQGIRKEHVFTVCCICSLSDALLIGVGVSGFHVLIAKAPWVESVARYAGAAFLMGYALLSFRSAWKETKYFDASGSNRKSWGVTLSICLAMTWLNPHVYLDTLVLLGSISTQFAQEKIAFFLGATIASITFFFVLGYGARLLTPLFRNSVSWKVLDVFVGILMLTIAVMLLIQ